MRLSDASATFLGESGADLAGYALASGDVDGDGYDDVVVGALLQADRGAVYVVNGGSSLILGELTLDHADAKLTGEAVGDDAGYSLAMGDLDGDGYDDLVVGAPGESTGGSAAGSAYALYGGAEGLSTVGLGSADANLHGRTAMAYWGISLAAHGDVNGDGSADLLIGAPGADDGGDASGVVYLLYGGTSRWSGALDVSSTAVRFVGDPGDSVGWAIAHAGDMDGDGGGDVLINGADVAYLFLGADTPVTGDLSPSAAHAAYQGTDALDEVGSALAGAADVDADGYDDILVGAKGDAGSGAAYLVLGSPLPDSGLVTLQTMPGVTRFRGEASGDWAGAAVAGVGDVDADGFADVLIGAPYADLGGTDGGAAYLFLGEGSLSGSVYLSTADAVMTGAESFEAGRTVGAAGDVNGDGWSDILVGAWQEETAFLLYGSD